MSRFDPPSELPLIGKILYWITFIGGMLLISYFVLPLVYEHVSIPLGDWGYELVRSYTGEPYKPRDY